MSAVIEDYASGWVCNYQGGFWGSSPSDAVHLIKNVKFGPVWQRLSHSITLHRCPGTSSGFIREGGQHLGQNKNCKPACKSDSVLSFPPQSGAGSSDPSVPGASEESESLAGNISWIVCIHSAETLVFHLHSLGNCRFSHLACTQAW